MAYRKNITPEQKAKAEERRARFKQLVKQVSQMTDAERFEMIARVGAVVTCEGRALSPTNTVLCLMQLPGVSMVGGFKQWLRQGRSVVKGQHGISIWIPCVRKGTAEHFEINGRAEGDAPSETYFTSGTVFDISQTQPVEMEVAA